MSAPPNCVFCRIVSGEIPASVVFQSEYLLAFLDVGPLAEGHLLVVPKTHCESLADLAPEIAAELGRVLPRFGRALLEVTGAKGFNVLQNDGPAAGQVVPHVHFHLIPRRSGDNLGYRWLPGKYAEGRAAIIAAEFQERLLHF